MGLEVADKASPCSEESPTGRACGMLAREDTDLTCVYFATTRRLASATWRPISCTRSEVRYTLRLKVGLFRLCVGVIALVFLFIEPRNFHGNSPCATLLTDSWKSMRLLSVV